MGSSQPDTGPVTRREPPFTPPVRPPDPRVILVANALLVCVGYFLIGQWRKGLSILVAFLILSVGTLFLGAPFVPVILVLTAADGYLQARELQQGRSIGHWTFMQNHL